MNKAMGPFETFEYHNRRRRGAADDGRQTPADGSRLAGRRAGKWAAVIGLLAGAALLLAACAAPSLGGATAAPTMTAVPLPTETPIPLAQVEASGAKHTVQYTPSELATVLSQAAAGRQRFGGGQEQIEFQNGMVVIHNSFTGQSGQPISTTETVQLSAQNGSIQANVVSADNSGQGGPGLIGQSTPGATRRPRAQGTPGAGGSGFGQGQQFGARIASAITQALAATVSNGAAAASQPTVYVDSLAIQNNTMTIIFYTIAPQGAEATPGVLPQTGSLAPAGTVPGGTPVVTGTLPAGGLPSPLSPSLPTPLPSPTLLTAPAPAVQAPAATGRPEPASAAPAALTGKLVFETSSGGAIYTISAGGTGLRRLAEGMDPAWSPDGSQIAFTRAADPRGVWVINADGTGARRVFDWTEARWPSWVPALPGDPAAAAQILFSRQNGGTAGGTRCFRGRCVTIPPQTHWTLGLVSVSNGALDEPAGPKVALAPSWSPASEHLVYQGGQGLVVQSLDGSVQYAITKDALDTSPAWSPDGKQVIFVRRQHDHWELYVVNADGTNLRELTRTPAAPNGARANSVAPTWSPDGRYVAFLTDRTGSWQIWVMNADGSGQHPMFSTALKGITLDYGFGGEHALSWTQ